MRETLLNNSLPQLKPNLDKVKNALSDTSLSLKQSSFDTYLDSPKPITQKPKITPKPAQAPNEPKNITKTNAVKDKQETSEATEANTPDNTQETKTDNTTKDTTEEQEETQETSIQTTAVMIETPQTQTQTLMATISEALVPLTFDANSEQNLTTLDANIPLEAESIEGLNSINIAELITPAAENSQLETHSANNPTQEFTLDLNVTTDDKEAQNLELESDILEDSLSSQEELVQINFPQENTQKDIIAIDNNNLISVSEKPIQIDTQVSNQNTNTVLNNNFSPIQAPYLNNNTIGQIQIQKATQSEAVGQIPLQNDMSVTITKDSMNDNKIGINLEPAGMGEVELVIETNPDNAVMAVIRSDKPEILEQLRKESASLERYLSEAGLNLAGNGLSFEHKHNQNENNQQSNNPDTILSASISESSISSPSNTSKLSASERLYAHLDRQSAQAGLDIRL